MEQVIEGQVLFRGVLPIKEKDPLVALAHVPWDKIAMSVDHRHGRHQTIVEIMERIHRALQPPFAELRRNNLQTDAQILSHHTAMEFVMLASQFLKIREQLQVS